MGIRETVQGMAARLIAPPAAPTVGGRKDPEAALVGAEIIHDRIAVLRQARAAHAEVLTGREKAQAELQAVTAERGTAQARLTEKERAIALSDGPIPDEALPEEVEVNRLDRHVRICRARLNDWDEKVRKSEGALHPLIRDLETAWEELGLSMAEALLEKYRQAGAGLRDAWMELLAFSVHFPGRHSPTGYKMPFFRRVPSIPDLRTQNMILNVLDAQRPEKWAAGAQELLTELGRLRAEIKVATGGSAAPMDADPATDLEFDGADHSAISELG